MPLLWPQRCRGEWGLPRNEGPQLDEGSLYLSKSLYSKSQQDETFSILPASTIEMLDAQAIRYCHDFEMAVSLILTAKDAYQRSNRRAEDSFKYAWCIVNTRCLYYDPPSIFTHSTQQQDDSILADDGLPTPRLHSHDSNQFMVLCPLIDLFNHTPDSACCKVAHDSSGFTVTSQQTQPAAQGEELFVSYGPHSNDFLFVEYGFVLPDDENKRDSISLDPVILPTLSIDQRRKLDAKGYLGEYTLFAPAANRGEAGVCWRTEVVARVGIVTAEQWEGLVDGLVSEDELGGDVEEKANAMIRAWVETMQEQAERSVRALEKIGNYQQEFTRLFGDDIENTKDAKVTAPSTGNDRADLKINESETQVARRRYDLVFQRWRQILHICQSYLRQDRT